MREVTLSSGEKARVRIQHGLVTHPGSGAMRRGTTVKLTVGNRRFVFDSVCHPGDNFCRRTGRRLAADKMVRRCRTAEGFLNTLTKEDRRQLFRAVCPELCG